VLDASDRPVGDLVVEAIVDGDELLRLGMDAVDGQVEVPVLRVAVQSIERLVAGQAHLVQEHPGRLVSLGRRRLLPSRQLKIQCCTGCGLRLAVSARSIISCTCPS
jgi:hypothetical protein